MSNAVAYSTETPDSTIPVTEVPSATLDIILGTAEGTERDAGIFTKDDLVNIKMYVKDGLSLPDTEAKTEEYLGYSDSGSTELNPPAMFLLFKDLTSHCFRWDAIEQDTIKQSIDLDNYAKRILSTGNAILQVIEQMPITERCQTVDETELADVTYTSDDEIIAGELSKILASMKEDIESELAKTAKVKVKVGNFRVDIPGGTYKAVSETGEITDTEVRSLNLEPRVKGKKDTMDNMGLAEQIKGLQEQIDETEARIEQLKKDYDKYLGLAFTGAAGGVVGLAITGGIFGDKAEKTRKEKNKEIKELKELKSQITGKKNLQKAIEHLQSTFNDLGTKLLDAEGALLHLEFMWTTMLASIQDSMDQFEKIDNGESLIMFQAQFPLVIDPWESVQNSAEQLMDIIDIALNEYQASAYQPAW